MQTQIELTLTYDGTLPSNGNPQQKHAIRQVLHPQIKELWRHPPFSSFANKIAPGGDAIVAVGGRNFASVAGPWLSDMHAHLDILMLRPGQPGDIITTGGDIDNRLKTLFDALARPQNPHDIPSSWTQQADEDPLHCLLDDDKLITKVTVRTERLLLPSVPPNEVRLVIGVEVGPRATGILGGS